MKRSLTFTVKVSHEFRRKGLQAWTKLAHKRVWCWKPSKAWDLMECEGTDCQLCEQIVRYNLITSEEKKIESSHRSNKWGTFCVGAQIRPCSPFPNWICSINVIVLPVSRVSGKLECRLIMAQELHNNKVLDREHDSSIQVDENSVYNLYIKTCIRLSLLPSPFLILSWKLTPEKLFNTSSFNIIMPVFHFLFIRRYQSDTQMKEVSALEQDWDFFIRMNGTWFINTYPISWDLLKRLHSTLRTFRFTVWSTTYISHVEKWAHITEWSES